MNAPGQDFGRALWADDSDIRRANPRLLNAPGRYLGDWKGQPLRLESDGPGISSAGSRSGKTSEILMVNALTYPGPTVRFDPRGEIHAVSMDNAVRFRKHVYHIAPLGGGMTCDPLDILTLDGGTLHGDAMLIAEMLTPLSGGGNSQYFELRAREWKSSILISDVEQHGRTGLPALHRIINSIEANPDGFKAFANKMLQSPGESVRRTAAEIVTKQAQTPREFGSVMGEIYKNLAFMNDPNLVRSLENPDFSLAVTRNPDQAADVNIGIPVEYLGIWSRYVRLIFGVSMLYKMRRPEAPPVHYEIDEAGQLVKGGFEMLMRAYTFGAGAGVIPTSYFQSIAQMDPDDARIYIGSSQVRQFFGIRDLPTAEMVSRMLGDATHAYDEPLVSEDARYQAHQSMRAFFRGADPFQTAREYAHYQRRSQYQAKQARPLAKPDELLQMPEPRQILFISGVNVPPICAWKQRYDLRRDCAGLFMPHPTHSKHKDRVQIMGRSGPKWARVITEPVPKRFRDYPQYRDGLWSYVQGFKP